MRSVYCGLMGMILMVCIGCQMLESGAVKSLFKEEGLSEETIIRGLKEALREGSKKAAATLSQPGGYANDAQLRIPIPEDLHDVAAKLRKIGMGRLVDEFEAAMNEAAEHAAKQAVPVFVNALKGMTFNEARRILKGHDTAATDYFRRVTTAQLRQAYGPVVTQVMNEIGAVRKCNELIARYTSIPLVKPVEFSVEGHVIDRALQGLFTSIAHIERDIRHNAAARTTELLREVFGGK